MPTILDSTTRGGCCITQCQLQRSPVTVQHTLHSKFMDSKRQWPLLCIRVTWQHYPQSCPHQIMVSPASRSPHHLHIYATHALTLSHHYEIDHMTKLSSWMCPSTIVYLFLLEPSIHYQKLQCLLTLALQSKVGIFFLHKRVTGLLLIMGRCCYKRLRDLVACTWNVRSLVENSGDIWICQKRCLCNGVSAGADVVDRKLDLLVGELQRYGVSVAGIQETK